jgi:hypothetical protein
MRVQLGLSGTLANTSGNFSWLESRRWLVSAELLLCIINVYTAHHSSLIFFFVRRITFAHFLQHPMKKRINYRCSSPL